MTGRSAVSEGIKTESITWSVGPLDLEFKWSSTAALRISKEFVGPVQQSFNPVSDRCADVVTQHQIEYPLPRTKSRSNHSSMRGLCRRGSEEPRDRRPSEGYYQGNGHVRALLESCGQDNRRNTLYILNMKPPLYGAHADQQATDQSHRVGEFVNEARHFSPQRTGVP